MSHHTTGKASALSAFNWRGEGSINGEFLMRGLNLGKPIGTPPPLLTSSIATVQKVKQRPATGRSASV